ncbi:MAG: MgtC/SapB family protein [Blastocatellia bacterium]
MDQLSPLFQQLGIAMGLGLLVGLQRESAAAPLAGVRTFPLVTVLGTVCALLVQSFGGWVLAAGIVGLAALIFIGKQTEFRKEQPDPGLTTEVVILLMFVVGAYLVVGSREVAIAIGGGVAVLLQFKGQLHGMVAKLGENDLKAFMQFVLISLVILPVLPNRTYLPYAVINPRNIWWMVVLIVGISLGGYIIYKFFGQESGIVLGGILGGLISSTATTASYSKRTKSSPDSVNLAAIVIMIASTVVFARLMIEIATVAPDFLKAAALPLLIMLVLLALLSALLWFRYRHGQNAMPEMENPSELKSALFFGLVYAVILFAVAAAKEHFGNRGLFIVAGISGLTDVDAITLSTSRLVSDGRLSAESGWKVILIAALSNLIFKGGMIALLGHRLLMIKLLPCYGAALVTGILLLLFYLPA